MLKRRKIVTALDIASSKVCAAMVEQDNANQIRILAAHKIDSTGLKRTVVTDIAETSQAIKHLLKELKESSGINKHSVYINISGNHLETKCCHGAVMISNPKRTIAKRDIENVITSAHTHGVSLDRMPIHSLVFDYIVDEHDGIVNPLQMHAKKLEVDLFVITGVTNYIKNLKKSVHQAGYDVKDLVASGLSGSFSVLSEQEKESGVILIDLGAGVTDIAYFTKARLKNLKVIPKGADDITKSLSRRLKISISYAEEIKKRYGCASSTSHEQDEEVVLKDSNSNIKTIKRKVITECIKLSLEDILSTIDSALKEIGCLKGASCGIVFTGGGALLDGMIEMAQEVFTLPVRLGLPRNFKSSRNLNTPTWSNCLGLAKYALLKESKSSNLSQNNPFVFIKSKIEDLMTEYF